MISRLPILMCFHCFLLATPSLASHLNQDPTFEAESSPEETSASEEAPQTSETPEASDSAKADDPAKNGEKTKNGNADTARIQSFVSILDPKNASDTFGKRIAKRFIVFQVNLQNNHGELDYLVNDVVVDAREFFGERGESFLSNFSSRDLALLRGVAERGAEYDTRNLVLKVLEGVGIVASGLVGVYGFGRHYAPSAAFFEGSVVPGYRLLFPDFTIVQLHRANDLTFTANLIVPPRQSRVLAIFLPQRVFLTGAQQSEFWKRPHDLLKGQAGKKLLNLIFDVKGNHIIEVARLAPIISDVNFPEEEKAKFEHDRPVVEGRVVGRFLEGADIAIADSSVPMSLERISEASSETRIAFRLTSNEQVPLGSRFTIRVVKNDRIATYPVKVGYLLRRPIVNQLTLEGDLWAAGTLRFSVAGDRLDKVESIDVEVGSRPLEGEASITRRDSNGLEWQIQLSSPAVEDEVSEVEVKVTVATTDGLSGAGSLSVERVREPEPDPDDGEDVEDENNDVDEL